MDNTQCNAVRVSHKLGENHAYDIALVNAEKDLTFKNQV